MIKYYTYIENSNDYDYYVKRYYFGSLRETTKHIIIDADCTSAIVKVCIMLFIYVCSLNDSCFIKN